MGAKAILLGRIGFKDLKFTSNNTPLCKLSVATERRWINAKGERKKEVFWHNVAFFDKMADIAMKHTEVGHQVYIEGNIEHRKKEHMGEERYYYSIVGTHIEFLPNKQDICEEDNSSSGFESGLPIKNDKTDNLNDDVPF